MTRPRSGALRRRLRLESPASESTDGGGASITWSLVAEVWAEITQPSGREVVASDGLAARATHNVRIRYRRDVAPTMRFVSGSQILDIRAVSDADGRQRWLSCLCEETTA